MHQQQNKNEVKTVSQSEVKYMIANVLNTRVPSANREAVAVLHIYIFLVLDQLNSTNERSRALPPHTVKWSFYIKIK